MALEDILAAIEAATAEEAQRIRETTRLEVEQVLAAAEDKAATIRNEASRARDEEISRTVASTVNRARLEADRLLARTREDVFEEALDELDRRLAAIRASDRYPELLGRLVEEALEALPPATVIRCDPRDAELLARLFPSVTVDGSLTTWGGVIADSGDGREADNRLETRRRRAEPVLRLLAGRHLPAEVP